MQYTIPEINDGLAKVEWADGTWTFIPLSSDMTEEDFDDLVYRITPPHLQTGGEAPSFLTAGSTRTAAEKTFESVADTDDRPAWLVARQEAYGSMATQIEYITENGLDAWQTKVAEIKAANPKPSE